MLQYMHVFEEINDFSQHVDFQIVANLLRNHFIFTVELLQYIRSILLWKQIQKCLYVLKCSLSVLHMLLNLIYFLLGTYLVYALQISLLLLLIWQTYTVHI